MRCVATLPSGRPCRRFAEAGSNTCWQHPAAELKSVPSFYTQYLSAPDRRQLVSAAQVDGIDGEQAFLRVVAVKALAADNLAEARRSAESVARLEKIRHSTGESLSGINHFLDSVLAEMASDTLLAAVCNLDSSPDPEAPDAEPPDPEPPDGPTTE